MKIPKDQGMVKPNFTFSRGWALIANIKTNPRNAKQENQEEHYFDEELYKKRTVIERANAWVDGFKALVVYLNV